MALTTPTTHVHAAPIPASDAAALRARFDAAPTFEAFLPTAVQNADLWRSVARLVKVDDEVVARVAALGGRFHLLVLSEDWCGDAVNSVPYLARLAELAPNLELRVLARDANLDLMDAHLTGTARSIPVVVVYDAAWAEHGWWGPRPTALQEWVLGPGQALEKEDRYKEVRTWYARDRGRSTLAEIVALLQQIVAAA
ncbi:MAG TPA: thioredoxin family protein [Gemmatirosa sp.]